MIFFFVYPLNMAPKRKSEGQKSQTPTKKADQKSQATTIPYHDSIDWSALPGGKLDPKLEAEMRSIYLQGLQSIRETEENGTDIHELFDENLVVELKKNTEFAKKIVKGLHDEGREQLRVAISTIVTVGALTLIAINVHRWISSTLDDANKGADNIEQERWRTVKHAQAALDSGQKELKRRMEQYESDRKILSENSAFAATFNPVTLLRRALVVWNPGRQLIDPRHVEDMQDTLSQLTDAANKAWEHVLNPTPISTLQHLSNVGPTMLVPWLKNWTISNISNMLWNTKNVTAMFKKAKVYLQGLKRAFVKDYYTDIKSYVNDDTDALERWLYKSNGVYYLQKLPMTLTKFGPALTELTDEVWDAGNGDNETKYVLTCKTIPNIQIATPTTDDPRSTAPLLARNNLFSLSSKLDEDDQPILNENEYRREIIGVTASALKTEIGRKNAAITILRQAVKFFAELAVHDIQPKYTSSIKRNRCMEVAKRDHPQRLKMYDTPTDYCAWDGYYLVAAMVTAHVHLHLLTEANRWVSTVPFNLAFQMKGAISRALSVAFSSLALYGAGYNPFVASTASGQMSLYACKKIVPIALSTIYMSFAAVSKHVSTKLKEVPDMSLKKRQFTVRDAIESYAPATFIAHLLRIQFRPGKINTSVVAALESDLPSETQQNLRELNLTTNSPETLPAEIKVQLLKCSTVRTIKKCNARTNECSWLKGKGCTESSSASSVPATPKFPAQVKCKRLRKADCKTPCNWQVGQGCNNLSTAAVPNRGLQPSHNGLTHVSE